MEAVKTTEFCSNCKRETIHDFSEESDRDGITYKLVCCECKLETTQYEPYKHE